MGWNLVAPNTWSNSNAPFIIKYDSNTSQYIVETIDGVNQIPFSDIFNNPVFPIDLSNADVIVKSLVSSGVVSGTHLRSEGVNTPSTPGHSFKNEINSGLFRESVGVLAFSILGNVVGRIGAGYGGFVGNVIQWINDKTQTSKTTGLNTYVDIEKGAGITWEVPITPKFANSKIIIIFRGAFNISAASGVMGVRINQKLNSGGTYNVIWKPEEANTASPFNPIDVGSGATTAMYKNDYFIQAYHNPTYSLGDILYYKFQFASYIAGSLTNNNSRTGNNGETSVSILEIAQ